jgi:hypothetical protein
MRKLITFPLILWIAIGLFGFLAYREFLQINILAYVGEQNIWASRRFIAFLAITTVSIGAYFSVLFPSIRKFFTKLFSFFTQLPNSLKLLLSSALVLLPGLVKWTLPLPENFHIGFWIEFFLILVFSALIVALHSNKETTQWQKLGFTASLIMAAGAAHSILYKFNSVTNYPFTLYWSEGNRFFDYSTLFGSFRYITQPGVIIKVFINWGMQVPWALPFIFPNISIGLYRFWYQLVWILPSLLLGLTTVWTGRKSQPSIWFVFAFSIWTYLFLSQGPIYAPLVIGAIFTIIAVRQKTWLGAIIIFIISFYTRSSRWTWSYAPGIWAGLLALLNQVQPTLKRADWPKLSKPIVLGIAGYLGGQLLPMIIRKLNTGASIRLLPNPIASTTRQPLLWERLYPNPTFPPGILGALAWVALPLIIWLIVVILSKKWPINWLQKISIVTVAGTFLTVGIIASVKIGGGSNLHNLDMFLVSLMLITASTMLSLGQKGNIFSDQTPLINLLLIAVLITPVTYALVGGSRLVLPSDEATRESLTAVQTKIEEYSQQGEILFIDHRQLLTFNLVKNVPLIDAYEKKYLMDYAMTADEAYFDPFYQDLRDQRFALIVNEPANIIIRGSEYSFGEENDAYVHWVTKPLLCAYEPIYTSIETGVQMLIPRDTPPPAEMECQEVFIP